MDDASSIYAAHLARKMASSGFLAGRAQARCVAAAVLAARHSHGMVRTVGDVESASGVPRRQISATCGQVCKTFGIAVPAQVPAG